MTYSSTAATVSDLTNPFTGIINLKIRLVYLFLLKQLKVLVKSTNSIFLKRLLAKPLKQLNKRIKRFSGDICVSRSGPLKMEIMI